MAIYPASLIALAFALSIAAEKPARELCFLPDSCYCKVTVELTDGSGNPASGWNVPGCGLCLGLFLEVVNESKGQCRGVANCPAGDPVKCKGDLKVSVTSSSMACCSTAAPGGWQPDWGAGAFTWGSSTTKTWPNVEASCNNSDKRDFTINMLDVNGVSVASLTRQAHLKCGICGSGG